MTAILLSLASAATFGGMTVAIRAGMRGDDAAGSAAAMLVWSTLVTAVAALPRHDLHDAWPFLLAGVFAPGCSQALFTRSVREAGPSRTSVTSGTAPLLAVGIALVFLGEPVSAGRLAGALCVVAGGVLLAFERDRPGHVRPAALLYAVAATVLFAVRDNVVRALHTHGGSPRTAATATMLSGLCVSLLWARRLPSRPEIGWLAPAGILFGLSYVCLFEAYFHGRVSVVSPLVATESLWGVGLSLVLFRASEGIGRRVVGGAALVVAGGVLIGVFA